jgi:ribosome biogenesis GTPase
MGGRKLLRDDDSRPQRARRVRGFARGHGAHHRHKPGQDAPHQFGSGLDRTADETRVRGLKRLGDEELADLSATERRGLSERRIQELTEAHSFGAPLEGVTAQGIVTEVRRGNFLTRLLTPPPAPPQVPPPSMGGGQGEGAPLWRPGDVMRTFVRGTMQQFDLGLASLVAPGDGVEVIVPPQTGDETPHLILARVAPRRTEFRRLHPSGRAVQTIAANVDQVCVVASAAEPEFRPGFVDRVLVCAAASDLPALLIYNKTDLPGRKEDAALLEVYRNLNVEVFRISVLDVDSPRGDFAALKARLAGKRTVLTGHSGVGKTTLLLALDPALDEEEVRIYEVSHATNKGVHSTTHGRLFTLALGGEAHAEIIDTPGVRELTPTDTDRKNLWAWFPEIAARVGQCAFPSCTHTVEKGCGVLAAVERGEIHPRRHQSYVRIYETLPG